MLISCLHPPHFGFYCKCYIVGWVVSIFDVLEMFGEWLLCRIMPACSFATLADIILNFWRSVTKLSNDQGDFEVPGIAEHVFFGLSLCIFVHVYILYVCIYIYILCWYILYVYIHFYTYVFFTVYTHIYIYSHPWWNTSHVFIATNDETRAMFFLLTFFVQWYTILISHGLHPRRVHCWKLSATSKLKRYHSIRHCKWWFREGILEFLTIW